jgi:hypothetical protein
MQQMDGVRPGTHCVEVLKGMSSVVGTNRRRYAAGVIVTSLIGIVATNGSTAVAQDRLEQTLAAKGTWSYDNGVVESMVQTVRRQSGAIAIQQILVREHAQIAREQWDIVYPVAKLERVEIQTRTNTSPSTYSVTVNCRDGVACIASTVNGLERSGASDSLHFTSLASARAATALLRRLISPSVSIAAPSSPAPVRPPLVRQPTTVIPEKPSQSDGPTLVDTLQWLRDVLPRTLAYERRQVFDDGQYVETENRETIRSATSNGCTITWITESTESSTWRNPRFRENDKNDQSTRSVTVDLTKVDPKGSVKEYKASETRPTYRIEAAYGYPIYFTAVGVFGDRAMAERVASAVSHAAKLCGSKKDVF